MKTCQWCNEDFRPNRDWQEFCCKDHQQRWHRHQRKLCEVRAAETLRANGGPQSLKEIIDRFARVNAEIEAHEVPAQVERLHRRL